MAVQALSGVAAPIVGGVLYGIVGMQPLIIISCTSFFLSAVMEIFIKIPFVKRAYHGHIVSTIAEDLKDGFVYVVKQPFILKSMVLAALLNLLLTPYFIVGIPIILRVTMQSSETLYGFGIGLINLAAIIGALTIGIFARQMSSFANRHDYDYYFYLRGCQSTEENTQRELRKGDGNYNCGIPMRCPARSGYIRYCF